MTYITIVRHGTTEWMEHGLLHGRLDSKLSPRGLHEAQCVAAQLRGQHFDAFYSSPAGRAIETANTIASEIGMHPLPLEGLREIDFGPMEGRRMSPPLDGGLPAWLRLRWTLLAPVFRLTSESRQAVGRRVVEALTWIARQHPDGHVLIVTHSGTHSTLIRLIAPEVAAHSPRMVPFAPCAITEIKVQPDGTPRLLHLNQTEHLLGQEECA